MAFQPYPIIGYESGLKTSRKPFLITDDAFQVLENAYNFRSRIKKREGIKLVGRLRRVLSEESGGNVTIAGDDTTTFNLFTQLGITGESNASLELGDKTTITLEFAAPLAQTWTDSTGTGVMTGFSGSITAVSINYSTGDVIVVDNGAGFASSALTVSLAYYPGLPAMGIDLREDAAINDEQTIFFDTKYAYTYDGNDFTSPFTQTWAGTNSDFFWMANYRGSDASDRLLFVTNGAAPALEPENTIFYLDSLDVWNDFTPGVAGTAGNPETADATFIFQAKLIVPYYGRLLFLNTWEGTLESNAENFYNRCRFSQIGNPIQETDVGPPFVGGAWRSDVFGKGGFIDAPTAESIVSARFYKNTLIVFFERSTWQLRYVGEYGLPFLWERISSDFGSESTFSTVLFDDGVLAVGDKAIIASSGNDLQRIDLDIPDRVFTFQNKEDGKKRVQAARDFQKEVVYWSYVEPNEDGTSRTFPTNVLLFNYRNSTWATFRDSVTCFGILTNNSQGTSWDSPISWDSPVPWNSFYTSEFPNIVSGNQQGFIHYYQFVLDPDSETDHEVPLMEHESLYIRSVTRNASDPINLEITDHNLLQDEIIYLTGMVFVNTSTGVALTTDLNDKFYLVTIVDEDNVTLSEWNESLQAYEQTTGDIIGYTPAAGTGTYMGGGVVALLPRLNIWTKDFNPLQDKGHQIKSSYTDFQLDFIPYGQVTIAQYINSSLSEQANMSLYDDTLNMTLNNVGEITGATQANPTNITSVDHGLTTGRQIEIGYVNGMTELNGNLYTVTYVDKDNFTIDEDSSGFTAYSNGGMWVAVDDNFFYVAGASYSYQRFYSNVFGQYLTYNITYGDDLMNRYVTHITDFELNGMVLYIKPAGRMIL